MCHRRLTKRGQRKEASSMHLACINFFILPSSYCHPSMVSTIDEEDIPYYRNLEETDHAFPQVSSPTESHRRGASQPNLYINEWVDHSSRSLPHLGHRRGVSHPANTYRDYGLETSNDAFRYLTAGDRRRSSLPEIYNNNGPQTSRSSVLRAIFTPRVSEIEDLEDTHSPLYIMLHPRSGAWYSEIFKKFISTLIIGDLLAFVISTEDSIYQQHWIWFQAIEGITASIFLVEYIARVTVSVENKKFGIHGPVLGRIRWMTTFHAIIDILATAPFFIQVLTGHPMPRLTYLRIFRVLRIMKTDSYARAFSACYRVVYFNREILWVAVLICFFLIVTSSVLLYYCRPRDGEDDDIEFQSIPSTLYLSVLILTGQDSFIRSSQTMPVRATKCTNRTICAPAHRPSQRRTVVHKNGSWVDRSTVCCTLCYPRVAVDLGL